MGTKLITRKDYMTNMSGKTDEERTEAHRKYFAQFVTEGTKRNVLRSIGERPIKESTDKHMNDIPLRRWDMAGCVCDQDKVRKAGEGFAPATRVCINKEAARQIKEELENE